MFSFPLAEHLNTKRIERININFNYIVLFLLSTQDNHVRCLLVGLQSGRHQSNLQLRETSFNPGVEPFQIDFGVGAWGSKTLGKS